MASKVLRRYINDLYVGSPVLANLGLGEETIGPTFTPDGPSGDLFLVLRWGTTTPGIATVHHVKLQCWAYNRQPDYGPIEDILSEVKRLLAGLGPTVLAPRQSILEVRFDGDSEDLFDDGYRAQARWTSHTITASGS